MARWRGDWSCCCRGIPKSAPEGLFLFERILLLNPALPGSLCTRKGLSSHSAHLSSYAGIVRVRAPHSPTLNSPQPAPSVSGLQVCSLCPYSPPCNFKQRGLSWCFSSFVWQGRELLTGSLPGVLRQAPHRRAWGCSCPGPCIGTRDLFVLKQSPYLLSSQCPLFFLVSYLHKHWAAFGCSLCFSVEWVGVSPRCRGKLTLLPPISPPSAL